MSYAHEDDERDDYYLSEFRKLLCQEVSARLGREFSIFQDRASITLGQKWKTQIETALSTVTFFMPIITPAFFESRECRAELDVFLQRETEMQRDDLIWPIYYIECSLLENDEEAERNRHAQKILEHHYADWRALRKVPLTSSSALRKIQEIAEQVCITLKRRVWGPVISVESADRLAILESFRAHEGGENYTGGIGSVAFSPSSEILATASDDSTVRLWDLPHADLLHTLEGHAAYVTSVAFSPDGETLVSGSHDGTVRLWSVSSGQLQHVFKYRKPPARALPDDVIRREFVSGVAFHPFEPQVAAAYFDEYVRIWSVDKKKLLKKWEGLAFMNSIAYSPSSDFLAAGSMGNGAHAWIAYDGETAYDLTYKNKREKTRASAPLAVNQLAFSSDRKFIATAANTDPANPGVDVEAPMTHCVRLWEAGEGKFVRDLIGHTSDVNSVAFSPDNTLLASASTDSILRLWSVPDGRLISTMELSPLGSVAFSANGSLLVCGSFEGSVTLLAIK